MEPEEAFGLDAFALDDRLRLFTFATVDKRTDYLAVLRAFDRARANYVVLLHAGDVEAGIEDVTPLLDQLYHWNARRNVSHPVVPAVLLVSYATRIGERLEEAGVLAHDPVENERLLPVLAERSQVVEETFEKMFTNLVQKSATITNGAGWDAGQAAADRADITIKRQAVDA